MKNLEALVRSIFNKEDPRSATGKTSDSKDEED